MYMSYVCMYAYIIYTDILYLYMNYTHTHTHTTHAHNTRTQGFTKKKAAAMLHKL